MSGITMTQQRLRIVGQYRESGRPWPATTRQMAEWAIREGLWARRPDSQVGQCADELARAMREEYYTDPQGREVRAKHVARVKRDGVQSSLWDDIRNAGTRHMQIAFQQRRHQIVGDCKQIKADVDSFNENGNLEAPIQMVLDFTVDVTELEVLEAAKGLLIVGSNGPTPRAEQSRVAVPV